MKEKYSEIKKPRLSKGREDGNERQGVELRNLNYL